MMHVLPGPLHRLVLQVAHGLRLRWWQATGKTVRGTIVIAADGQGCVLLVRHSYHDPDTWMLPGGGLDPGESPLEGAYRELAEETGCTLQSPRFIGTITFDRGGWVNLIELVTGRTEDSPLADGREILEARFFDPDALPAATSGKAREMILRWLTDQNGSSA